MECFSSALKVLCRIHSYLYNIQFCINIYSGYLETLLVNVSVKSGGKGNHWGFAAHASQTQSAFAAPIYRQSANSLGQRAGAFAHDLSELGMPCNVAQNTNAQQQQFMSGQLSSPSPFGMLANNLGALSTLGQATTSGAKAKQSLVNNIAELYNLTLASPPPSSIILTSSLW